MTDEKTMQQEIPLKLIHMNDVQETKTHWLWYPYIPYGKITIIQGDPGEGKTTLVLHLAAEAKAKKASNVMVLLTQRRYMECFIEYRLPIRKRRQDRPLTWVNDAELDKLSALNAAINNGETVDTFRRRFHDLTEQEKAEKRAIEHMIYTGERDTKKLTEARAHLDEIKAAQKGAAEKLEMIEKIMNGTYIQDMLDKFSERKRSEVVPNGYSNANTRVRRR